MSNDNLIPRIIETIREEPGAWQHYNNLYLVIADMPKGPDKWRHSEELKRLCGEGIADRLPIAPKLSELIRETLLMEAQGLRFDSYMQYVELFREPEKRFWLPRRKQLLPVVEAIQDLIDDKLDTLAISLPPGTGKSTLEIFLHTMLLGAFPDKPSLASGHSGSLTSSIYDGVMEIISDKDEYLWHEVYPDVTQIITNAKEQTIDINKKHRFSSLTCRSLGGSITGATRAEVLLSADDLVSGIEQAMSVGRLEKLWNEYTSDLKTRRKLDCKELHVATRWSVHDVIGRLEVFYAGDDRARFVVIPAVNEKGESNFNYDYGLGFDEAYFEDMRISMDDASFRALFMNEPIEREGLLYQEDELRRYFELPEGEPDAILAVCDTKDTGSDYAMLPVAYVYGDNYYIEDVVYDNGLPEVVDIRLADILVRNKVKMARFESNSAGGKTAEKVQGLVKDRGGVTHITTKFTLTNKQTRIIINSPWVKEKCLFKDRSKYHRNSEYERFVRALCSYTVSGKNANDDAPDGMSMLAEFVESMEGGRVEIFNRFF